MTLPIPKIIREKLNWNGSVDPAMYDHIRFIVVDLFCGAGGTSTGFEQGLDDNGHQVAKVVVAINHDHQAIESHWANHPHVFHFEEDIRKVNMKKLKSVVAFYRKMYRNAKLILHASLECTNFSKAKGGLPRDADSRTLAEHLDPYVVTLNPDMITIENVVEFMSWGPLDENGKPVSRKAGSDWIKWRNKMCSHGYIDDWKELNSADFGAYTSRNRLFGQFIRTDQNFAWPEPTHAKKIKSQGFFADLKKWKAVRDVLDLQDEGKTIFNRKKPLSPKTLERIYAGLVKYVAGGKEAFIVKWRSHKGTNFNGAVQGIDDTGPLITTMNHLGIASCEFISKYYSGNPDDKNISVDGPAGTLTTIDSQALVKADFLLKYNSTSSDGVGVGNCNSDIDNPAPVIGTQRQPNLVSASFMANYYSNGDNTSGIDEPSRTLRTGDGHSLITSNWLDQQFTSGSKHSSVDDPHGCVMPVPKSNLVTSEFLMDTQFSNGPKSLDNPCPTITANRKHHYIVNPAWGVNSNSSDEKPCPVIVARQDKAPLSIVTVEGGRVAVPIYPEDCEAMRKIKEFMVLYDIVDIKMRMLKVQELLDIQGFPKGYILRGNQTDQKKFIGNSVVPLVAKVWVEAMAQKITDSKKKVA